MQIGTCIILAFLCKMGGRGRRIVRKLDAQIAWGIQYRLRNKNGRRGCTPDLHTLNTQFSVFFLTREVYM